MKPPDGLKARLTKTSPSQATPPPPPPPKSRDKHRRKGSVALHRQDWKSKEPLRSPTRFMLRTYGARGFRRVPSTVARPVLAPSVRPLRTGRGAHGVVRGCTVPPAIQARGKKTKTTVNLADLPQGLIAAQPVPLEPLQDGPAYPTVVLQARRNMAKFDNCVLLTRVGGFYELYFEHAEEYGPLLNLKVASKKTNAGPVPMVRQPPCLLEHRGFAWFSWVALTVHTGRLPILPAGSLPQGSRPGPESLRCRGRGVPQ